MVRRQTDLREIANEALLLFRQSVGDRIAIEIDVPTEPVALHVDSVLLRHALCKLLTNAAQAMGGNGGIALALRPAARDGKAGWRLSVADDGPGIPPSLETRIFEPFFTTGPEGSGHALPVAMHVALLHDGGVEVRNRTEGGAEFALWLPTDMNEGGDRT